MSLYSHIVLILTNFLGSNFHFHFYFTFTSQLKVVLYCSIDYSC